MARYRKRRYSNGNFTRQRFQWFFDIQTKADQMQVISVAAGGNHVRGRLSGFFGMYRYFKLGNISVKLVPASTLPVDPTNLSLEAGENTVDPRDQLNPGMIRITNGEKIFKDISSLTKDQQFGLYNAMVMDPRWYKFMLQKGVSRHATPLYWDVGQLEQDIYPGSVTNYPVTGLDTSPSPYDAKDIVETASQQQFFPKPSDDNYVNGQIPGYGRPVKGSDPRGLFQTGRATLGWLPTTTILDPFEYVLEPSGGGIQNFSTELQAAYTPVPEVEVMNIVLPPAHKTEYYYRCFVTEEVLFKEICQNGGFAHNPLISNTQVTIDNLQLSTLRPCLPTKVFDGISPDNDGGKI